MMNLYDWPYHDDAERLDYEEMIAQAFEEKEAREEIMDLLLEGYMEEQDLLDLYA